MLSEMKKIFKGNEGIRIIVECEGNYIKVIDYLLIDDKLRLEEYSSFEFGDLIEEVLREDEDVNAVTDYLSVLDMWVRDYEDKKEVSEQFINLSLLKDTEIPKINPDQMLMDFVLNKSKVKICMY